MLGGAKVSDKLGVIDNLLGKVDRLLVGGGMAFTFLKAQGHEVGKWLLQEDQLDTVRGTSRRPQARRRARAAGRHGGRDRVRRRRRRTRSSTPTAIPADRMGLDIGPRSRELFAGELADAATVFWNGPMGVFEFGAFADGTRARRRGARSTSTAFTVVGGGDSAAAVRALGFAEAGFGHISTGGGASLEYLEGKTLPGLAVLED